MTERSEEEKEGPAERHRCLKREDHSTGADSLLAQQEKGALRQGNQTQ